MKKNFKLTHPKNKVERIADAIKSEVRKYIKRERNKTLPDKVDYWDFDCRYGADEESSEVIHVSALNKSIDHAVLNQLESIYLEIMVKPGIRTKKPKMVEDVMGGDAEIPSAEGEE